MMGNVFWTGYCDKERIAAISEIERIVDLYGFITDFKQFSDISISIMIELEESRVDVLYNALKRFVNLNEYEGLHSTSNRERSIFLNITFSKGTGDLRVEVPAVPG